MSAKLELVSKMVGSLPNCAFCSAGGTSAVTAPGVDINWGDNLYMCDGCVRVAAQLIGLLPEEKVEEIQNRNEFLEKRIEQVVTELGEANARIDRMLEGARAKREAREARKGAKKNA